MSFVVFWCYAVLRCAGLGVLLSSQVFQAILKYAMLSKVNSAILQMLLCTQLFMDVCSRCVAT